MAKGWLGRTRAASNAQPNGDIGTPNLMWSDAAPRQDLHALGQVTPTATSSESPIGMSAVGNDRPRTANDRSKPISRWDTRPEMPTTQSFDVALEKPRPSHLNLQAAPEDAMIGMALGSPTHPPFRAPTQQLGQSKLALQMDSQLSAEDLSKVKGNKWKKLGGLFKAKNALASQGANSANSPFYSLQSQYAAHVSPGNDSKPAVYQESPSFTGYNFPDKAQRLMGGNGSASGAQGWKPTPPTQISSGRKASIEATSSHRRGRSRSVTGSHRATNSKDSKASEASRLSLEEDFKAFEKSPMFLNSLPSLDIEIPDASMERYSIMFSNVLGNSKSSNLLARRSRMLEKLRTISDEAENTHTEPMPGLPSNPKDQAHLAPQPQPRRATSPTPAKSPGFSLFPQPPSGVNDSAGAATSSPRDKSGPLQRSFTAPGRLSPRRQEFDLNTNEPIIEKEAEMVDSPGQTTSTTRGHNKWSSDGSYLSPASTASSDHQDQAEDIIFNVKALSYVNENNEPQWEMVSTDNIPELTVAAMNNLRGEHKPSPLADVETPTPLSPTVNDDALAALEAPPPPGQDLAPLRPTKAAIDRIMSPPPMSRIPMPTARPNDHTRKEVVMPKLKVRTRADTNASRPVAPVPIAVPVATKPSIEHLMTAVTNDLDDLEQQIESRAVKAMKKQVRAKEEQARSASPVVGPAQKRLPPVRSNTEDAVQTESRAVRAAKKQATNLNKAKSLDSIVAAAQSQAAQQKSSTPPMPTKVRRVSPLDIVRALSPAPVDDDDDDEERPHGAKGPSFLITSARSSNADIGHVQVARSISVSKRQQRLVPMGKGNQSEENLVERTMQGALMPKVVDVNNTASVGKTRGHRYERSQNVVVESA